MPTADFRPQTCLSPGGCWRLHRWVKLGQVPGHLAHEPFEALAVEVVAELLLSRDVPCRKVPVLRPALVDVLCVLIHPHLGHPLQVLWGQQPCGKTKGKKKTDERSLYKPSTLAFRTAPLFLLRKDFHSHPLFLSSFRREIIFIIL